jgi:hypothetical protein
VQLSLPWSDPGVARSEDPVVFVRHRRARRYILRVLPDGTIRVTLPRWGARREAREFIEASRSWITKQRELRRASATNLDWRDGTEFLLDGEAARVTLAPAPGGIRVWCDGATVATITSGRRSVRDAVEAWMCARARVELPAALLALAATHGIEVARVSVRNQRSRWGACSPAGTITLNWRLIQAPPFVREYVLLHELMHRRQMNHSRRFWRLVADCCPRHAEARRWLRKEGKSLWADRELS